MTKIALTLIVKNEEKNIEECLDSLQGFYDKAFITDTGSTDQTIEVLKKRSDVTLSHFKWVDDFAKARNYNLQQVPENYDWIIWCDADDRIIDDDAAKKFREFIKTIPETVNSVNMPYVYSHNNQTIERGIPEFQYHRKRLIRNNGSCEWKGFIHEHPATSGPEIKWGEVVFHHYRDGTGKMNTKRNLRIFRKHLQTMSGGDLARYTFYYAKELVYNNLLDEALKEFDKYVPMSRWVPEKARALLEMGLIYERTKRPLEARKKAFECLEIEPHNSDAHLLLCRLAYNEKDYQASYLWAYHALHSDEEKVLFFDYLPARTWKPLEYMAWCRYYQGKPEEALKHIIEALEYVPKHSHLLETKKKFNKYI